MRKGFAPGYTLRSTSWLTLANYFVRAMGFAFVILALKRFDAGGYGEYVLINNYLMVLATFGGLGLTNLINAKVADNKQNARLLPAYNISSCAVLALSCAILHAAKPSIPAVVLALFWLSSGLTQILFMRYFQNQLHKRWAVINLGQSALAYGGMLIGLWLGSGLQGLFTIHFCAKVLSCLTLLLLDRGKIGGIGGADLAGSFSAFAVLVRTSGFWMIGNVIVNKLLSESIPIILGEGISLAFLGTYDMIFKIIGLFDTPLYAMESVITSRQSRASIHTVRRRFLPAIIGISLVLAVATFVTINLVYRFVLGTAIDGGFVFATAAFSLTVASLGHRVFNRASLTILEKTDSMMWNNMVSTLIYTLGAFYIVWSGSTELHHVALLYLATSLVSAALYELNYKRMTSKGLSFG